MRRRDFILTGLGFLGGLALPLVAAAEEPKRERDPRWNGEYTNLGQEAHDHDKCGCGEWTSDGSFHWVRNAGVDARSQRINRFRSIHSGVIWRARAFPGSVRRGHGFHGRRVYRGPGRR
jgi:hypothetical protein